MHTVRRAGADPDAHNFVMLTYTQVIKSSPAPPLFSPSDITAAGLNSAMRCWHPLLGHPPYAQAAQQSGPADAAEAASADEGLDQQAAGGSEGGDAATGAHGTAGIGQSVPAAASMARRTMQRDAGGVASTGAPGAAGATTVAGQATAGTAGGASKWLGKGAARKGMTSGSRQPDKAAQEIAKHAAKGPIGMIVMSISNVQMVGAMCGCLSPDLGLAVLLTYRAFCMVCRLLSGTHLALCARRSMWRPPPTSSRLSSVGRTGCAAQHASACGAVDRRPHVCRCQ
jgi:hypothetical protein